MTLLGNVKGIFPKVCQYSVNYVGYSKMCKCVLGGGRACSTPGRQSKLMREGREGASMPCYELFRNLQKCAKHSEIPQQYWWELDGKQSGDEVKREGKVMSGCWLQAKSLSITPPI